MRKGFTLIEILVVVGIMVVISLLVIPKLGSAIATYNLHTSTRAIVAQIQLTRDTAVADQVTWQVKFLQSNRQVRFFRDPDYMNDVSSMRLTLPNGIFFGHTGTLDFNINLVGDFNRLLTITLQTAASDTPGIQKLYIVVSAAGRIRISRTAP